MSATAHSSLAGYPIFEGYVPIEQEFHDMSDPRELSVFVLYMVESGILQQGIFPEVKYLDKQEMSRVRVSKQPKQILANAGWTAIAAAFAQENTEEGFRSYFNRSANQIDPKKSDAVAEAFDILKSYHRVGPPNVHEYTQAA